MTRLIRIMLTMAFGLSILLSAASARGQTKKNDADSTAIEQVVSGFMANFNNHDAHAISAWFTEDSDYTNGGGINTHGRKAIEEHYLTLFAGPLANAQRTGVTVKSIRFLSPEIASVDISYVLEGLKASDGSISPSRAGLYTWTLVKQNDHWLIAVLHEIGIGQGPSPPQHR
jgi:uncharacterized protein (TIGR02246 family)